MDLLFFKIKKEIKNIINPLIFNSKNIYKILVLMT